MVSALVTKRIGPPPFHAGMAGTKVPPGVYWVCVVTFNDPKAGTKALYWGDLLTDDGKDQFSISFMEAAKFIHQVDLLAAWKARGQPVPSTAKVLFRQVNCVSTSNKDPQKP